ncbi:hypothetical protein swp_3210 [Shewanella piezotolerans WP3]|uniref:Uncharacterized protein n=1 Tax=Shewanella piezotolerans (strain WP3 / JCM 13877) TaxID=225849 RepID=B8CRB0_SHEPW|nr:hypothetical protein swp_3210 [Shewanella piezotolerans WP3]
MFCTKLTRETTTNKGLNHLLTFNQQLVNSSELKLTSSDLMLLG